MTFSTILLLAGKGERIGLPLNKVYYEISSVPLYRFSLDVFLNDPDCKQIIIVYNKDDLSILKQTLPKDERIVLTTGADKRSSSVRCGLKLATEKYTFIHDGARCLLTSSMVRLCKEGLKYHDAVCLANKVTDTHKMVVDGTIATLDRNCLYAVQTPQCAKTSILKQALATGNYTDDMEAIEKNTNVIPYLLINDEINLKVTVPIDLQIVQAILEKRKNEL